MNSNLTECQIRDRIEECLLWAQRYDYDYEPDDPANLAEDYRREAEQLKAML